MQDMDYTSRSGSMGSGAMTGDDSPASRSEGTTARMIERQTSRLPSDTFLWAAIGAMGAAAVLQLSHRKEESLFIGQWVAPFLLFGVYNKLVKQHGSDQFDH